jgi:hypothetical protein
LSNQTVKKERGVEVDFNTGEKVDFNTGETDLRGKISQFDSNMVQN